MHCCPPAHLLPYQDTRTAVVVMPLVRDVTFHIMQWKFEFLKFKTKLLIQVLRATSAHLQHKNSTLLLSAQLWQCLPAKRDFKRYCSQSSPSSNKTKGTQQKKQSTPFTRDSDPSSASEPFSYKTLLCHGTVSPLNCEWCTTIAPAEHTSLERDDTASVPLHLGWTEQDLL